MSKALATILIGEDFQALWKRRMAPSWQAYAARHGYDVVTVDDYIDKGPRGRERTPHWQKCLILEDERVRRYDDVVWLDADIMINHHTAPCIVSATEPGRIGLVSSREQDYGSPAIRDNLLARRTDLVPESRRPDLPKDCRERYLKAGLSGEVDDYANTGVLVLKPERHAALLRHVYDSYEENPFTAKEEACLSHAIFNSGLAQGLDSRFNTAWYHLMVEHYPFLMLEESRRNPLLVAMAVNAGWSNCWFMHFTADVDRSYADLVVQNATYLEGFRIAFRLLGRGG
ncbi:MAG: hypothetical protein H7841_12420 [Magnetospirillum sp. WYHS-4]